jgi:hypothetical protein
MERAATSSQPEDIFAICFAKSLVSRERKCSSMNESHAAIIELVARIDLPRFALSAN